MTQLPFRPILFVCREEPDAKRYKIKIIKFRTFVHPEHINWQLSCYFYILLWRNCKLFVEYLRIISCGNGGYSHPSYFHDWLDVYPIPVGFPFPMGIPWKWGLFPFPSVPLPRLTLCLSHPHGISISSGNPIPMVVSNVYLLWRTRGWLFNVDDNVVLSTKTKLRVLINQLQVLFERSVVVRNFWEDCNKFPEIFRRKVSSSQP